MIEVYIDVNFVKKLIYKQCKGYSIFPIRPIESSGTQHSLYRLGNDYLIRLPKIEWELGSCNLNTLKEYKVTSNLANKLSISISEPVFLGYPNQQYPWHWSIVRWNDGYNPLFESVEEYSGLAIELATFINELHKVKMTDIPYSRRGLDLSVVDNETRNCILKLGNEFDSGLLLDLWFSYSHVAKWDKNPVLVHGDLLPGNILVKNKHLNAVIDFSDVGIGDPACDLVIAWSLFKEKSREVFKNHLAGIDNNTWLRGKAWALSIAVIMLPYYKNSNLVMAQLARTIINNLLTDK
jgi:aminoglycoside phosphotransferase (APT) family kinase protein